MFRLLVLILLNEMTNYHNATYREVTFTASVQSDLPLRKHNYGVCYATVQSPYPQCSAGIKTMSKAQFPAIRNAPHRTCHWPVSCGVA